MRIHLVSATRSPVRLVKDERELRKLHGPGDMFGESAGAIPLDDVTAVTLVAPYSPPGRPGVWFLFGTAAGLFAISLGIDLRLLRMAAFLPLAFAIVLAIIPTGASSTRVLARVVAAGQPYMLALAREDLSAFRIEVPGARWTDEEEGLDARPLKPHERLRLRLMQIGLVMTMTSVSSVAMLYLQQQPQMMDDGPSADVLSWFLKAAESVALVLFVACWIAIALTGLDAKRSRNRGGDRQHPADDRRRGVD
jgi:hypothetical protein